MVDVSAHNLATYSGAFTTWTYLREDDLFPCETSILSRLGPEIRASRVLDIGVGAGRTTSHLLKLAKNYVGVDYSAKMIERCRSKHPSASFEVCDARDLSRFVSGSFDFVMFSFNGIDCMDHKDRFTTINEIRRVLTDKGTFVFSSHNKKASVKRPWDPRNLPINVNPFSRPLRFAKRLGGYPAGIVNYMLRKQHQQQADDYAIVVDEAHFYRNLNYYVKIPYQIQQLKNSGFRSVEIVNFDGEWIGEDAAIEALEDTWVYYVCCK